MSFKKEINGSKKFKWWCNLACGAPTNSNKVEKESIHFGFKTLGDIYRANRDQGKSFIRKQSTPDKTPWQNKMSYWVIDTFTDTAYLGVN